MNITKFSLIHSRRFYVFRDLSIPSLESVLAKDASICEEAAKLKQFLGKQSMAESSLCSDSIFQECMPPSVCHDYQTARLFLSHFGLLQLEIDEVRFFILKLDFILIMDYKKRIFYILICMKLKIGRYFV